MGDHPNLDGSQLGMSQQENVTKYSASQPRDDRGRFTDGIGRGDSELSMGVDGLAQAAMREIEGEDHRPARAAEFTGAQAAMNGTPTGGTGLWGSITDILGRAFRSAPGIDTPHRGR